MSEIVLKLDKIAGSNFSILKYCESKNKVIESVWRRYFAEATDVIE